MQVFSHKWLSSRGERKCNDLSFYPPKSSFRILISSLEFIQFSFSTTQDKISFKEGGTPAGSMVENLYLAALEPKTRYLDSNHVVTLVSWFLTFLSKGGIQ